VSALVAGFFYSVSIQFARQAQQQQPRHGATAVKRQQFGHIRIPPAQR